MRFKFFLAILSFLIITLLMFFYFMPLNHLDFTPKTGNSNFSLVENSEMQYYPNLRFSESAISYKISNCSLKKEDEMESAFEIMKNFTSLEFYPVEENEKISVGCEDKNRVENGFFIADFFQKTF